MTVRAPIFDLLEANLFCLICRTVSQYRSLVGARHTDHIEQNFRKNWESKLGISWMCTAGESTIQTVFPRLTTVGSFTGISMPSNHPGRVETKAEHTWLGKHKFESMFLSRSVTRGAWKDGIFNVPVPDLCFHLVANLYS